ncbi:MAG: hypothetical protein AB9903_27710 [Vulcanimicrobiota bacterium]
MMENDGIGVRILKRVYELSLSPSNESMISSIEKDIIKELGFCKVSIMAYLLYFESKGFIKKISRINRYMIRLKGIEIIQRERAKHQQEAMKW